MTKTNMDLSTLLAKHDQGDLLRNIAEAVLQLIMEADVDGLIGAGKHERSGERTTSRNGYRERALDTRLGTLNLRVPKLRQGSYFPGFLRARKTSEQAMGLSGISKSTVSKLCKDIDERVGEFLNRSLTGEWPYLWLDATYLKVRQGGRIVPVAAIIAVAANTEGRREIIGLGIGPSEAETFWTEFLRSLRARGLGGVRLVISDANNCLKAAIARVFEATWQRCRVHWMRNALAHVSRGQHTVVAAASGQAFDQPDRAHAGEIWHKVADQLRARWPKLADLMDASEHDVLAYMSFSRQHRTKLHSTNPIERLNKEVKRRADVVGIFPNEASIMRLIGAVLFEQNDEWQTASRYMMVEAFAQIDKEEIDPILSVVEIDAVGQGRACPNCGGSQRSRWGTTRTGSQRWRCGDCNRTWTGRTGTPLAGVHRPVLFIEVARNMLDPNDTPLSCRKLGHRLGVSRDTVWRWRMLVLDQIKTVVPAVFSRIIETDDTAQRESRKGSREWVRHERDPSQPKPPRLRWYEYPKRRPPQAIAKAFEEPILGIVDRTGRASFQHIVNKRQPAIDAALVPQIAPDAMVLFDGAPQYEAIAKARVISYHVLIGGRRSRLTPKAYHLNTVNSLHAQWEKFIPLWRGPATKYLDGYARWLVARRWADPAALFRAIIS